MSVFATLPAVLSGVATVITAVKSIFGGGDHATTERTEYYQDPALLMAIQKAQNNLDALKSQIAERETHKKANDAEHVELQNFLEKETSTLASLLETQQRVSQEFIVRERQYSMQVGTQNSELMACLAEISSLKINSLDELQSKDEARFLKIVRLCSKVTPAPMVGTNVGFFGLDSVGKSTLINALMNDTACKTGYGSTTIEIAWYRSPSLSITFWDIPGQNDEFSYITAQYVSCMKSMSVIGIMISKTINEMLNTIRMLELLHIKYHLIVNKIDCVEIDAVNAFKTQIMSQTVGLNLLQRVYFVSAKLKTDDFDLLRESVLRRV